MKRFIVLTLILAFVSTANAQWQHTLGPCAGKVNCFTIHDNDILAGTYSGFAVSSDHGATWTGRNTGFFQSQEVNSIAVSGITTIAATNFGGVYWSVNNGNTWTRTLAGLQDLGLLSSAVLSDTFYLGGGKAIYKSADGINWTVIKHGLPYNPMVYSLAVLGTKIFAGTQSAGIFLSNDRGANWTAVNNGFTALTQVNALVVKDSYLYAGTAFGVYFTVDDGASWHSMSSGLPSGFAVTSIAVKGSDLYAGTKGKGIYKSTDNGNHWSFAGLTGVTVTSLVYDGTYILTGTDGMGALRSSDDGATWTLANNGLVYIYTSSFAVSDTSVFCGGNNGVYLSHDDGQTWSPVKGFPSYYDNGARVIAMGTNIFAGNGTGIYTTPDGGTTWNRLTDATGNPVYGSLAVTDSVLYAAGNSPGLWRSFDKGSTWSSTAFTQSDIFSIAANGSDVWLGCNPGLYRSSDFGTHWHLATNGLTDDFYIFTVVANDSSVFAGTISGAFRSGNRGENWDHIDLGLDNQAVYSLLTVGPRILAGTHSGGVYFSSNNGNNWIQANNGLADSMVVAFGMNRNYVFIGTPSGVWRRSLPELYFMNMHPDSLSLSETENSYDTLYMESNDNWTISGILPGWLAVNKSSGSGSDTLIFHSTTQNPGSDPRIASLSIATEMAPATPVTITQVPKHQGVETLIANRVKVFPNPTHGLLAIASERPLEKVAVSDATGAIIREITVSEKNVNLDFSSLSGGIYFITLTGKNWISNQKVVVF